MCIPVFKNSQASKGTSVRQSKGPSVRQSKDSQASKGALSVKQAKDRCQASKGLFPRQAKVHIHAFNATYILKSFIYKFIDLDMQLNIVH